MHKTFDSARCFCRSHLQSRRRRRRLFLCDRAKRNSTRCGVVDERVYARNERYSVVVRREKSLVTVNFKNGREVHF